MAQITLNSTGVASNGALVLQSNGTTTAVTISTAQVATLEKDAVVNGLTVGRGAGAVSTNTAVGASALAANTTGAQNTAIGIQALQSTTSGDNNTAVGRLALKSNTTGASNTAVGRDALQINTTGSDNSAVGLFALFNNTTGASNTALGVQALNANTTGNNNTAIGYQAGYTNTTSATNAFLGAYSGYATTGASNTFVGISAGEVVTSGAKNTILGRYSGNQGGLDIRTASNYIVLSDGDGNPRLWVTNGPFLFCPAVYADTAAASANVGVLSTGEIFRTTSSLKYKKNVATTAHGLDDVMKLRAVTYQSNRADENGIVYGGLIAEEVHAAGLTEFVQYAEDGSPDALHYANMVSLAFKAIQELKAEFDAYKEAHP
jgi:hypothetical protein